ncbi:MAG: hypothetical protein SPK23_02940 [Eubacteriales bacterium]|nr:hypothetical protein [Clostridiales bacterium]MDY5836066.1 hypothetical protein [Eubacteriales bacterium]
MSHIQRYGLLLWLTLKSYMKPAYFLIFILLAPASLGLIAGLGNRANLTNDVHVAIVDQLEDADSAAMIDYFRDNHWDVLLTDHASAQQWLKYGEIDAIITIKPELKDYLAGNNRVRYVEVEQEQSSLMQLSLMMTITAYGDSEQLVREFADELADLAGKQGQDPVAIRAQYYERMAEYENGLAQDPVAFENRIDQPRQTVLVGDYSLLLLYLAVAAVSQTSLLERPIRRLLAVPGAFRADFTAIYVVHYVSGFLQILVYSLAMAGASGRPIMPASLLTLAVYLLCVMTLAFWLLLMPKDTRLFCGLFLVFLLALFGGILFPLPGNTMVKFGQYTPLGWAMAALSGLETDLPHSLIALICLVLTLTGLLAVREQGRKQSRI